MFFCLFCFLRCSWAGNLPDNPGYNFDNSSNMYKKCSKRHKWDGFGNCNYLVMFISFIYFVALLIKSHNVTESVQFEAK